MGDKAKDDRTFVFWLGVAAKEARKQGTLPIEELAKSAGLKGPNGAQTLRRFERGEQMPHRIDSILAVYAYVAGLPDARAIYADAIKRWRESGEAPTAPPFLEEVNRHLQQMEAIRRAAELADKRRAGGDESGAPAREDQSPPKAGQPRRQDKRRPA